MSKRLKLAIAIALAVLICFALVKYITNEVKKSPSIIKEKKDQIGKVQTKNVAPIKKEETNTLKITSAQKQVPQKKKSLNKIVDRFSKISPKGYKTSDFKLLLGELNLEPYINNEKSGNGKMTIIRTTNNLPGTRYIHAQFFGEGKKQFMQHLSFEYQKGEKSFEDVVSKIKQTYPIKLDSEYRNQNFVKWDLDQDYQIWVKELNRDDMRHDPFNAYDLDQDPGTIRVTVEMKIH